MIRSSKIVGAVAFVALVLGVAVPAAALPPQCEFSCTCNSRCTQVCAIGNWVTTCAFDQICRDFCFTGGAEDVAQSGSAACDSEPAYAESLEASGQPATPSGGTPAEVSETVPAPPGGAF